MLGCISALLAAGVVSAGANSGVAVREKPLRAPIAAPVGGRSFSTPEFLFVLQRLGPLLPPSDQEKVSTLIYAHFRDADHDEAAALNAQRDDVQIQSAAVLIKAHPQAVELIQGVHEFLGNHRMDRGANPVEMKALSDKISKRLMGEFAVLLEQGNAPQSVVVNGVPRQAPR